jgi:hypothetical protein
MESDERQSVIRDIAERRFWHEGDILTLRTEFFLIGQGILFEAFFSAASFKLRGLEIAAFGLVSSFAWLMVGARNDWHIRFISAVVSTPEVAGDATVAEFKKGILAIRDREPKWLRWAHSLLLFGRVMPFVCFDAWVSLTLQLWLSKVVVVIACLSLAGVAIIVFRKWPRRDLDRDARSLVESLKLFPPNELRRHEKRDTE